MKKKTRKKIRAAQDKKQIKEKPGKAIGHHAKGDLINAEKEYERPYKPATTMPDISTT